MSGRKMIGVIGCRDGAHCIPVLSALAQSCGLELCAGELAEVGRFVGCIVVGGAADWSDLSAFGACRVLRVIESDEWVDDASVCFSAKTVCPMPFRGRTVVTGCAGPGPMPEKAGEAVASADDRPIWMSSCEGGSRRDTCWVPRRWIRKEDCVFDHLNRKRFMSLLPVLEWLRAVSDWNDWEHPPLRACFMFDDPNLHGRRYGFVDFAQLADDARRHHYHSSFAMVPLDSYYVHDGTARIIRENGRMLSFLMHGNNHTYRELAGRQAWADRLALMQQAVHRITSLEQRSGVPVARVMAPPHGVCSAEMMAAMRGAGLEAVCVSHGSVWSGNPGVEWTVALGANPALVVEGLPVIPRFGLDRDPLNHVLLAAYLRQPIIPVGHHWDLADGLDILSSAAQIINGLGEVIWTGLSAITRSNYRFKVVNQTMRVHSFSRIASVEIPIDVSEVEMEMPWVDRSLESFNVSEFSQAGHRPVQWSSTGLGLGVAGGTKVDLLVVRNGDHDNPSSPMPRTPPGVIARKVLVELRDRAMPYLPRKFVKR